MSSISSNDGLKTLLVMDLENMTDTSQAVIDKEAVEAFEILDKEDKLIRGKSVLSKP